MSLPFPLMLLLNLMPATVLLCGVMFLCGDEHAPGAWGRVSRFFLGTLPNGVRTACLALPGGRRAVDGAGRTWDYVFYKPNPVLQAFYLFLMLGGFFLYHVVGGVTLIEATFPHHSFHVWFPYVFFNFVMYTFFKASRASPGYVTKDNVHQLEALYAYDGFLYVKRTCDTCKLPRVARSKHDRFSNRCVEKFDHWCPWINNAVGARNYRWFLLFVFSTMAFLGYAAAVLAIALAHVVHAERLWDAEFVHTVTRERVKATPMIVMQYLMTSRAPVVFLFTLCLVMSVCLLLFFAYHVYLLLTGVTTNESAKWSSVSSFYKSKAFKEKVLLREPPRTAEEEAKFITPEFGRSIEERDTDEFPRVMPKHAYNFGVMDNIRTVVYPPFLYGNPPGVKRHGEEWAKRFPAPPHPTTTAQNGKESKKKA